MAADLDGQGRLVHHARNTRDQSLPLEGRHISIRGKVVGNLVRLLSGSNALAQAYFTDYLIRNRICREGDVDRLTPAVMEQWWNEPAVAWAGCRALACLDDKFRVDADKFLVGSLLAEWALNTSRKGIVISLSALVEKYLRLWSFFDLHVIRCKFGWTHWRRTRPFGNGLDINFERLGLSNTTR